MVDNRSDAAGTGTEAAVRVADVLIALGSGDGYVGVSDLARSLGLSKTVVYRILRSLESRELVFYDPDRREYSLGMAALELARGAPNQSTLQQASHRSLRTLTEITGESAFVAGLVGARFVYIDHAHGSRRFEIDVPAFGETMPLYAGSSGKAILANAGTRLKNSILSSERPPLTRHTITDKDLLQRHLHQISRKGIAVSIGERREGVVGVSSAIFDRTNSAVGSVCVYGPTSRLGESVVPRLANLVRSASASITQLLRDRR